MDILVVIVLFYFIASILAKIAKSIAIIFEYIGFILSLLNWSLLDLSFTFSLSFFVSLYIAANTLIFGIIIIVLLVVVILASDSNDNEWFM